MFSVVLLKWYVSLPWFDFILYCSYDRLLQEKEDTEADFIQYKRELKNTTKGNATKEIRILKNLVKNLEEELMKEKTKHQRSASKRSQEYKQLLADLEDLRASERNLKIRIKSLTNELAIYKRCVWVLGIKTFMSFISYWYGIF